MENLTFGEQVKIILSRKGMTIKELAEQIEERTGKNMSRQNMTQRLKRDNFQEQDMRMIAEILGCSFRLSIMEQIEMETEKEQIKKGKPQSQKHAAERDITVGELVKMSEELQLISSLSPSKLLLFRVQIQSLLCKLPLRAGSSLCDSHYDFRYRALQAESVLHLPDISLPSFL